MPLPELTTDTQVTVEVTGRARSISGHLLVVLPYLAPVGTSRGRRYRVEVDSGPAVVRIVLSAGGQAALRPPESTSLSEGQLVTLRLRALPVRRACRIPEDVQRALDAADASLDRLNEAHAQHLLMMVREASDPAIRAERISAAIHALQQGNQSKT